MGLGANDGRLGFPDVPFKATTIEQIAELDDTVVFVNAFPEATTKHPSFVIFHCPPFDLDNEAWRQTHIDWTADKGVIVTSRYAAGAWSEYLRCLEEDLHVVYPFAEPEFANEPMLGKLGTRSVLYAGRLAPEKGIYTLLAALHFNDLQNFHVTVTDAGSHTPAGQVIAPMVRAHPRISFIDSLTTRRDMAKLYAHHDVVVVPTLGLQWAETFGMVSIEAQHVGCRVVASNIGGLPETDCGGLMLVEPLDPYALSVGIVEAARLGRLTPKERDEATKLFTLDASVSALLHVLDQPNPGRKLPY